jgi:ferredoxin
VQLRFADHDGQPLLAAIAPAGSRLIDVVRELARQGRLTLQWRCAQGTCGTCLVHLEHAGSGQPLQLTPMERNVLVRHGHLPAAANLTQIDEKQTPRLACHVRCSADLLIYIQKE